MSNISPRIELKFGQIPHDQADRRRTQKQSEKSATLLQNVIKVMTSANESQKSNQLKRSKEDISEKSNMDRSLLEQSLLDKGFLDKGFLDKTLLEK